MKQHSVPHRGPLLFLAGCAGVLAAGMAAVAAAGRFAPGREVTARAALPVQGALGAESADLLFWPEQMWEEYSVTDEARLQESFDVDRFVIQPWLTLAGWDGGAGPLPGSCWQASFEESDCFFARNVRFPSAQGDTARGLVAEISAGRRDDGFGVTCRVFADDGYQDLPAGWQEKAAQRCREELMYLLNLSNDEERAGLYGLLDTLTPGVEQPPEVSLFNDPELDSYWRRWGAKDFNCLLYDLAIRLKNTQRKAMQLYHQGGWQPPEDPLEGPLEGLWPHQTLNADPMPGEEKLALLMNNLELEVQVVPMERQAMVLFSWEQGDVAVYYDPVLDCFSGYSLQF